MHCKGGCLADAGAAKRTLALIRKLSDLASMTAMHALSNAACGGAVGGTTALSHI
jgi:hypothetical protein